MDLRECSGICFNLGRPCICKGNVGPALGRSLAASLRRLVCTIAHASR